MDKCFSVSISHWTGSTILVFRLVISAIFKTKGWLTKSSFENIVKWAVKIVVTAGRLLGWYSMKHIDELIFH